jgi:hypothetical protein
MFISMSDYKVNTYDDKDSKNDTNEQYISFCCKVNHGVFFEKKDGSFCVKDDGVIYETNGNRASDEPIDQFRIERNSNNKYDLIMRLHATGHTLTLKNVNLEGSFGAQSLWGSHYNFHNNASTLEQFSKAQSTDKLFEFMMNQKVRLNYNKDDVIIMEFDILDKSKSLEFKCREREYSSESYYINIIIPTKTESLMIDCDEEKIMKLVKLQNEDERRKFFNVYNVFYENKSDQPKTRRNELLWKLVLTLWLIVVVVIVCIVVWFFA